MSKVLKATCLAGIVTSSGVVVDAEVLSAGVGDSDGLLIVDDDKAYYLPGSSSADLKTTLDKLVAALAQVKTALDKSVEAVNKAGSALTQLDNAHYLLGATGAVPSIPIATTNITGITTASALVTTAATAIDTIKGQLQTLAGNLQ